MTAVETSPKTPTAASAWPVEQAEIHELPSGGVALLRRVPVMEMLRRGDIPNPLLDAALNVAQGGALTDYQEAAEFLAFSVASAFQEPRISLEDDPPDGELPLSAISDEDRRYVLGWIQQGVAGLGTFREERQGADAGGDGGGIRDEAE